MGFRYYTPCDPSCDSYHKAMNAFCDDPITEYYGLGGDNEFTDLIEKEHKKKCKRCREFGLANIEVVD